MPRRGRKRPVARHERRAEGLCKGYAHGVVRRDVLAQLPRARQEIDMRVTMEIEVGEIPIASAARAGDTLACPHEAPET